VFEISKKEFKSLVFKMINDFKEDLNKQMNQVKESIQDLFEPFSNLDEKFRNEIKILKQINRNKGNELLNKSNKISVEVSH
jgi:ABC-type thiamine transport system ATPase subunit